MIKKLKTYLDNIKSKKIVEEHIEQFDEKEFLEILKTTRVDSKLIVRNSELKKNSNVLNAMLDYDILCYKYFDKEAFTFDIIRKILSLNTIYDTELEKIISICYYNEEIIKELITKYPRIIVLLRNISIAIENLVLESGYIPDIVDIKENVNLINCKLIIAKGFEFNPQFIRFFSKEMITSNAIESLKIRNYIITEEDLKSNKCLRECSELMYEAIKNQPNLIKYISKKCMLPKKFIEYIDCKYFITLDDIKKYPDIIKNSSVVTAIPRLLKYSDFITYDQKLNIIIRLLLNNTNFSEENVPFLEKKKDPLNLELLNKLLQKIIKQKVNSVDANIFLDEIINQISCLRYENSKSKFYFQDIVKLNDYINKLLELNDLETLINQILDFTNNKLSVQFITSMINNFYLEFKDNNYIGLEKTSEFCNNILNIHRNNFINNERNKIINEIKSKLHLSLKKRKTIETRFKLKIIIDYIKNGNYDLLNTSKESLEQELNVLLEQLKNNKRIRQEQVSFKNYNQLVEYFLENGLITEEIVTKTLSISNNKIAHYIVKKINNIRIKYTSNVKINPIDYSKIKPNLALNYSNFMILSEEIFLINLANIILHLNDDIIVKFLDISDTSFFNYSLYFLNLIDEFSRDDYLNIILNYNKIIDKLNMSNISSLDLDLILVLSNYFANKNDIFKFIFDDKIIKSLDLEINEYLEFYKCVLSLNESNIPPVNLIIDDKLYISGQHDNPERLLIGKGQDFLSCIDLLETSGSNTYKEILSQPTSDVILVYENNKLINRILVFRRGNVIQLVTSLSEKLPINIFILIAENMLKKIKDDNIDFILVNKGSVIDENCNLKKINDINLIKAFPHADTTRIAYVLFKKNENMEFKAPIIGKYKKIRKTVVYKPDADVITRLRALDIILENDLELRKNKLQNFEPFIKDDYKLWISGDDWYIAITNSNQIEEFILPTAPIETYNEIEKTKENIIKKIR